jgi:sugar lactone lactonase YvrE
MEVTMPAEELFVSKLLTPENEYTGQIEGPAVDAAGNLYVCNFKIPEDVKTGGAIGKIAAGKAKSTLFATLPVVQSGSKSIKSKGSGIRFDRAGRMYVADFNNHNVFVFEPGQSKPQVYFHGDFHQPNDLAIAADGTLYASDPLRKSGVKISGRIWRITRGPDGKGSGEVMAGAFEMRATNGIDLSPDAKTLYVGEADTNIVWAYRFDGAKLTDRTKVAAFDAKPKTFDIDGLRTDVDGRIYVTQNGAGQVVVLKPDGTLVRSIKTTRKSPSNLTFGGPDGKTVFVTQADRGFVETFRVDRPGREPCMQLGGAFC